jgi:hypothetical protein
MSLLAGRGGEGCGMWCGDVAAGGNLRPFASNGGESVLMSAPANPAWCRGSPVSDIEAPPPNKLKAGWFLDLGLETPATSSRSSPRMKMFAVPALLAWRRGEEWRQYASTLVDSLGERSQGKPFPLCCHLAGKRAGATCCPGSEGRFPPGRDARALSCEYVSPPCCHPQDARQKTCALPYWH